MKIFFPILLLISCNLLSQNVMISKNNTPNEPSIMMDPNHPNVMIAASNINNYYVSSDTGNTWTEKRLQSSYGVWGDPAIVVDTAGDFYFFHLSNPPSGNWIDRIVCQKTTDQGKTWNNGSYTGLNGTKAQDKQWCAIDRTNNKMYLTWTQFDNYGSGSALDSSIILFSKSLDAGITWSTAKRINKIAGDCLDDDNTVEGAVPAVGPNGEVYVSWAGPQGIVFNKSVDEGESWLPSETLISTMPGGWNYDIPGISRANGLPVTVCDLSHGTHHGTIYVNWSDQRNGTTDTDIWLAKSIDGGGSWSAPVKVNDDNTNRHQFFTWMAIDQSNGSLYFVFYDRRNHTDAATDVYLAISNDGGETFTNLKISEAPFVPNSSIFFGDYTNIVAHDGIVRPIWTRLHNGQLSVWTDVTLNKKTLSDHLPIEVENKFSFENFPNPSSNEVYVSYKLHKRSMVEISLYNTEGKYISKIITPTSKEEGKYIERINIGDLGIASGIYLIKLKIDNNTKTVKQIVVGR